MTRDNVTAVCVYICVCAYVRVFTVVCLYAVFTQVLGGLDTVSFQKIIIIKTMKLKLH